MLPPKKGAFESPEGKSFAPTFFLVALLFLLWGFCNGLIDVMDKHFQDYLHLSKSQSANVQWAHYLGYALMALPAGLLTRRKGYKVGIITGLLLVAAGGFWFVPATHIAAFWAFLLGVCSIAMGLTILETVANPYTTVLGPKEHGAFRINLAQTFNGAGWILGPVIGRKFFYNSGGVDAAQAQLYIPYMGIGVVVLALAAVFFFAYVPDLNTEDEYHVDDPGLPVIKRSIWTHPHFIGAVAAQFFYVAAQAGIFSFFINYMIEQMPPVGAHLANGWFLKDGAALRTGSWFVNEQGATLLLGTVGFPLFLIGRALGSVIMRKAPAHRVLGAYALVNLALCALVVAKLGWISVAAVFLTFLFMSVMFPTIFALGIRGLGLQAKKASAFIVMSIAGGALMPKLMGHLGDVYDMAFSFIMPMCCFALIAIYGFSWAKLSKAQA